MCDATGLSQRRACLLTGLSLSTCRYEAQRPAADAHLSGRITSWHWSAGVLATSASGSYCVVKGWQQNVYRAPPGGSQPDLVDGFCHGRACHRSHDQVPDLCGRLHERVPDNYHRIGDFRRSGHAYSGQHSTVSRLSGDDKD